MWTQTTKPSETICGKPLTSAPRQLQKMFMRLQRYDIDIQYKRGLEMHLADTFSGPFTGDGVHLIRSDPGKMDKNGVLQAVRAIFKADILRARTA